MAFIKESKHLHIRFQDIENATKNFTTLIGKGGYGNVYKGELLLSGKLTTVAVKRLDANISGQGSKEFLTEIQLLSRYKHPNLVSLLGFCEEGNEKIIVYEHAEHGSLDKFLNMDSTVCPLTCIQKINICIDVARGLNYLHNHAARNHRVIHRDLKSANVLLDHNWKAMISDLGLSKIGYANENDNCLITNACGTPGYCDPVYIDTGVLTKESDVYSLGVVLFEVLCGRLCFMKVNDERRSLAHLARQYYQEGKLHEIIDPVMKEQLPSSSLNKVSDIAYQCLHSDREKRPSICSVVKKLKEALKLQRTSADHIWKELQVKPDMWLQMVHTDRQSLKTKIFAFQGPERLIKDGQKALPVEQWLGMKNYISDVNVKVSMQNLALFFTSFCKMLEKLNIQMNSEDWSMMEDRENKFLLVVIRDLLNFCEIIIGKDNKSAIASNFMNVIGQYSRFLKAQQKFLEPVDMACNTFLKILHTCKRKFVILQVGESEPHQIPTIYERPESKAAKQEEFLLRLMNLPTQKRTKIIGRARSSVDYFFYAKVDTDVIKTVLNILQQLKLVMDSVICAFRHTERNIAETRLKLLLEMLKKFQTSVFRNQFYCSLLVLIVQELLYVLTVTSFHKPGLKLHVLALQHLFILVMARFVNGLFESRADRPTFENHIRDFLVQFNESLTKEHKDLHAEEVAAQKEKERQLMLSISGLIAPDEMQYEMAKEAMKRLEGSLKQIDEMKATTQEALKRADMAVASMNTMEEELRRLRMRQANVESMILPKTQTHAPLPSTNIQNQNPPQKLMTKNMFLRNCIRRFQRRKS